ncbi:MAG: hypothetical protein D6707_06305 [Bacteroidetes bacterium]|nr:MAG: hypothetical protein D6707_06305 [Bacteroidota bacterium]
MLSTVTCFGQYKKRFRGKIDNHSPMNSRKIGEVIPTESYRYKMGGWKIEPGVTFMFPQSFSVLGSYDHKPYNPKWKPGLYLEIGRYKILEYSSFFRYFDYGIAYKSLRGKEKIPDNHFGDHFVSANFNLNGVINVTDYNFIAHGFGANLDYAFLRNVSGTMPALPVFQLHYKLGWGVKFTDTFIAVFYLQTPVLNGLPFENGRSTLGYYNSRFRPVIFTIQMLFLKEKQDVCPPVKTNDMFMEGMPENQ